MERMCKKVSVIMPTYNTPIDILKEAIDSVRQQTYTNFEFLIIDDCSTNETLNYLQTINDERVIIIRNKKNMGITCSLNIGLHMATGEYIARMDSDDIALPTRFEEQVKYMESHPKVVVCGTWIEAFGTQQYIQKRVLPCREYYRVSLLFGNIYGLTHPSAMFRKDIMDTNGILYNEQLPTAQDYGMWVTCIEVGEIVNVQQVLLKYRIHEGQVSFAKKQLQQQCAKFVQRGLLKKIFSECLDEYVDKHFEVCSNPYITPETIKWFEILKEENNKTKCYDSKQMTLFIKDFLLEKAVNTVRTVRNFKQLYELYKIIPKYLFFKVTEQLLARVLRIKIDG